MTTILDVEYRQCNWHNEVEHRQTSTALPLHSHTHQHHTQYVIRTSKSFKHANNKETILKDSARTQLIVIISSSVRLSVCLSSVCLSSVTFVHPTQAIENFGNVSMPCGTLAIRDLCIKILRRSSQGNPFVGRGLNPRGAAKYSDFGPFEGYIWETMQDMI